MENEEKEYRSWYLPKDVAEKMKAVCATDWLSQYILEYIDKTKKDWKSYCDSLDEDLLVYRACMAKARNEWKTAFQESTNAHYQLREETEAERKSLSSNVKILKEEIKPLQCELNEVDKLLKWFDLYKVKDLIEAIKEINWLYGENKKIIEFIMNNYKNTLT